jgi:tetratricopeptide (TPR) repeat protein
MSRKTKRAAAQAGPRTGARTGGRHEPPPTRSMWRSPWIECGLAGLTLVVYAQARHFQFVNWDDPTYVTANATVLGGLSWHSVWWALTSGDSPYWHPLTWLSHLMDVTLFGLDAGAHHMVSVALHVANTLMLFWVLRRILGDAGRSLAVAAIFAVHPVHVESVAWIAERKDVLSTFFMLAALWAYVRYVEHPSWPRYVAVAASFALALMAKPMMVTFPVLLLLLDYWPFRRSASAAHARATWRWLIVEKAPLLLMAAADGVVTIGLQARVGAMASLGALPAATRASQALVSYIAYAGQAIWPVHLAAFYPQRPVAPTLVALAVVTIAGVSGAAIACRERYPYVFVGWFWYLCSLGPVIGFLQAGEQARADRFMYVPLIGLALIVVCGGADVLKAMKARPLAPVLATTLVVAVSAADARAQTATWSDSVTLWRHASLETSGNYKAYEKLAEAKRDLGQLDDARLDYEHALALSPPDSPRYAALIHNDLGLVLERQQRASAAVQEFATAVALDPSLVAGQINLGDVLAANGRPSEAVAHFTAALRLEPDATGAYVGLGNILLEQGRPREAIGPFSTAITHRSDLADAHNGLGAALMETGSTEPAIAELVEAIRLRPRFPSAETNLAAALIKAGRADEARRHLEQALSEDPNLEAAKELLARLNKR